MNRTQKKCLIGATGFHLLLLLILLVGPAFFSSDRKIDDSQVITLMDLGKLTDGQTVTGGKPALPPPSAPPPPKVEPPATQPERIPAEKLPPPAPPKTPSEPAIEIPRQKAAAKPPAPEESVEAPPKKPKVEVATKPVKKSTGDSKAAAAAVAQERARQAAAERARVAAVKRALGNLREGLSTGTEVSVPGPGAATYVNYKSAIAAIYEQAWVAPTDATDDSAVAVATVTIARDGTVISAKLKTPSGDAATDRSVRDTLRRVKFTAPFPEGATDAERTFYITFDLKKKILG